MFKFVVVVLCVAAVAQAQRGGARIQAVDNELRQTTTPVPILRQINKVNEDGSYTYGYEGADGSYKIETKAKTGEVRGKYGYYDDTGVLREVEYGATRDGFRPQGTDIRQAESALAMNYDPVDDTGIYDAERYEKPFAYDRNAEQTQQQQPQQPARRPGGRRAGARKQKQYTLPAPVPQQQQQHTFNYQAPQAYQQPAPQNYQQPAPQTYQQPAPQTYQQPAPQAYQQPQQQYYQPQAPQPQPFNPAQLFHGHPARNLNIHTGSYNLEYTG